LDGDSVLIKPEFRFVTVFFFAIVVAFFTFNFLDPQIEQKSVEGKVVSSYCSGGGGKQVGGGCTAQIVLANQTSLNRPASERLAAETIIEVRVFRRKYSGLVTYE
jgi:hypothetical protein